MDNKFRKMNKILVVYLCCINILSLIVGLVISYDIFVHQDFINGLLPIVIVWLGSIYLLILMFKRDQ